jgi:hypothetical protein
MPQYLQLGDCLMSSCAYAVIAIIPKTITATSLIKKNIFLFIDSSLQVKYYAPADS